jgi:osmoprotectant transport system permease protein
MTCGMIDFIISKAPELFVKSKEHLMLTGISTSCAIFAGVPLGILITHYKVVRGAVLGVAGVVQTIPSLAMLAFLLPILGIGIKPAIVALTLYALLPIIRNTYTGLTNIPAEIIEAAIGLGFTKKQQLWIVELPLAMPVIFAGIRTAAVIGVGIATLSSFIGAGGLGDFINRGLALNNTNLIFLGAGTAAILALVIDFMLGMTEQLLWKRK